MDTSQHQTITEAHGTIVFFIVATLITDVDITKYLQNIAMNFGKKNPRISD